MVRSGRRKANRTEAKKKEEEDGKCDEAKKARTSAVDSRQSSSVPARVDFPRRFFLGCCHEKLLNEAARLALPERKVETLQWVKERHTGFHFLSAAPRYTPREHLPCLSFFFFLRASLAFSRGYR